MLRSTRNILSKSVHMVHGRSNICAHSFATVRTDDPVAAAEAIKQLSSKRFSVSLTTWFFMPENGMSEFEVLMRSSAFLVRVNNQKNIKSNFHLITASHNTAPWRFPNYYNEEWLKQVNEKHAYYTAEVRYSDGAFITQVELVPNVYHHPTRDLAVLHLDDESEAVKTLRDLGVQILDMDGDDPADEGELMFYGHEVVGETQFNSQGDSRLAQPRQIPGKMYISSEKQVFASTNIILAEGMCGGPVLAGQAACAMVEGIVPLGHRIAPLQGKASIIVASEIRDFLAKVENGEIAPVIGGDSAEQMGEKCTAEMAKDPYEYLRKNS